MNYVRHLIIFLALYSFNTLAAPCDDGMSPRAAVKQVLENGMRLGEIDANSLEINILGPNFKNPFKGRTKSPGNLSLRQAYDRHHQRLTPEEIKILREDIRTLVEQYNQKNNDINGARIETKPMIHLTIGEEVEADQRHHGFTKGIFQGRPVFISKFMFPGLQFRLAMIDYFRTDDPKERFVVFKGENIFDEDSSDGQIFSWNGHEYYVRNHNFAVYDLATRELVSPESGPWPNPRQVPFGNFVSHRPFSHVNNNKVKFLDVWNRRGDDERSGLMFWDSAMSPPQFRPLISGQPIFAEITRMNSTGPHSVVSLILRQNNREVHFFDVTDQPTKVKTVTLPEGYSVRTDGGAMPFVKDGKLQALIPYVKTDEFAHRLGVFDLTHTGPIDSSLYDIDLKSTHVQTLSRMTNLDIKGHPFALLHNGHSTMGLNLQTFQIEWSTSSISQHSFDQFSWKGEHFIVGTDRFNNIEVRESLTGLLRGQVHLPGRAIQSIMTFEYNGIPMALISRGDNRKPIFLHLVSSP